MQSEILIEKAEEELKDITSRSEKLSSTWMEFNDYISYNGADFCSHNLREMADTWQDMALCENIVLTKDEALDWLIDQLQWDCFNALERVETLEEEVKTLDQNWRIALMHVLPSRELP